VAIFHPCLTCLHKNCQRPLVLYIRDRLPTNADDVAQSKLGHVGASAQGSEANCSCALVWRPNFHRPYGGFLAKNMAVFDFVHGHADQPS
jgi:hypothetical protein